MPALDLHVGQTATGSASFASKPIRKLAVKIERQDGEVVLTGTTMCYRMLPRES